MIACPPPLSPLRCHSDTERGRRRLGSFYDPRPNLRRVAAAALQNQPASVPGATMSQPAATSGFAYSVSLAKISPITDISRHLLRTRFIASFTSGAWVARRPVTATEGALGREG